MEMGWQEKRPPEFSSGLHQGHGSPLDNLRNFFLTATTEMFSFFQTCEMR